MSFFDVHTRSVHPGGYCRCWDDVTHLTDLTGHHKNVQDTTEMYRTSQKRPGHHRNVWEAAPTPYAKIN